MVRTAAVNVSAAWTANSVDPGRHTILDLGYADRAVARDRADAVGQHVGRKRFLIHAYAGHRILVWVPPTRLARLMERFPIVPIAESPAEWHPYVWVTHAWLDAGDVWPIPEWAR